MIPTCISEDREAAAEAGIATGERSRGAALADFDGDGICDAGDTGQSDDSAAAARLASVCSIVDPLWAARSDTPVAFAAIGATRVPSEFGNIPVWESLSLEKETAIVRAAEQILGYARDVVVEYVRRRLYT